MTASLICLRISSEETNLPNNDNMTIVIFCFQTLRDNIYLLIAVLVMVLVAVIVVSLKILVSDFI